MFINRQRGAEGILDEAAKLDLENEFKTSNADQVIKIILEKVKTNLKQDQLVKLVDPTMIA